MLHPLILFYANGDDFKMNSPLDFEAITALFFIHPRELIATHAPFSICFTFTLQLNK